jgi:hypothetical protein
MSKSFRKVLEELCALSKTGGSREMMLNAVDRGAGLADGHELAPACLAPAEGSGAIATGLPVISNTPSKALRHIVVDKAFQVFRRSLIEESPNSEGSSC